MNVAKIEMPRYRALDLAREYRLAVEKNPNKEDRACMMGYRAIAQGRGVIDMRQAMRAAGLDANNCPRLCLGRADWPKVRLAWRTSVVEFQGPRQYKPIIIRGAFSGVEVGLRGGWESTTPMIPPKLRPAGDLRRYFILWEAAWVEMTRDPYLLRHLGGNLYVVLAAWDLTDIERAVMGSRA